MNNKIFSLKAGKTRFMVWTAFLGTLAAVVGYSDEPNHAAVYAQPSSGRATVVVQDDYVYYPGYEVYYSRTRHQYVYPEGGAWISRPVPRGVSVNVLLASPSVAVDFHDSPASHHAAMVKKYPKNWRQPDPDRGQTDNRRDDDHPHK